ncbi:MAG: caspase family protein [Campylobacterota bacterium]|nr:caspase family protein [Campylobacterota bacterium]
MKSIKILLILAFIVGNLFATIKPVVQIKPNTPTGIATNSKILVISDIVSNNIYVYEQSTNKLLKSITLEFKPTSIDIDNDVIYIGSNRGVYKLSDIDKKPTKLNIKLENNELVKKSIILNEKIVFMIYRYSLNNKPKPSKIIIYNKKVNKSKNISLTKNIRGISLDKYGYIKTYNNIKEKGFIKSKMKDYTFVLHNKSSEIICTKNINNNIYGFIFEKDFSGIFFIKKKKENIAFELGNKYNAIYTYLFNNEIYFIDKKNNKFNIKKIDIKTNNVANIFKNNIKSFSGIKDLELISYHNNDKFGKNYYGVYSTYKKDNKKISIEKFKNKILIRIKDKYYDKQGKKQRINKIEEIKIKTQNIIFCRLSDNQNFLLLSIFDKKREKNYIKIYDLRKKKFIYTKNFNILDMAISGIYIEKSNKILFTTTSRLNSLNILNNNTKSVDIDGINVITLYKNKVVVQDIDKQFIQKNYFYDKNLNLKYKYISFLNKKRIKIKSKNGNNVDISESCRIGYSGKLEKGEYSELRNKYCSSITILPNGYLKGSADYKKYLHFVDTEKLKTFSIDAFHDKFYRPDLLKKALEGKAITQKDTIKSIIKNTPPPKVTITKVSADISKDEKIKTTDKQYVYLTLDIKDSGGGIGEIRILNNGKLSDIHKHTKGFLLKRKNRSKNKIKKSNKIYLKSGTNNITVEVYNKNGTARSSIESYTVTSQAKDFDTKKTLHAVVIGIDKFEQSSLNLNYAKKDATTFANLLKSSASDLFDDVKVTLLDTKSLTSKMHIKKILKKLKANPNDTFVFYVSSHGYIDEDSGKYHLITSNFKGESLENTLNKDELTFLLGSINATNKLILFDTCFSGDATKDMLTDLANPALEKLARTGLTLLSGSSSKEEAIEGYKGHGLFTYTLLEGFKKLKKNNDKVTVSQLGSYVENQVPKYADTINFIQTPLFQKSGFNFEIGK